MLCRFLLDENMDPEIRDQLRIKAPGIEIMRVGDAGAPPRATLDPAILLWTEQNNYILVSKNRISMPRHLIDHFATGRNFPGLFWVDENMPMGEIIDFLLLAWGASEMEEHFNKIAKIPF